MEQILLFKFLIILFILTCMVQTIDNDYKVIKEYLSYSFLLSAAVLICYLTYVNVTFKGIIEALLWVSLILSGMVFWAGIDIEDTKTIKVSCNTFAIILIILIIFFI